MAQPQGFMLADIGDCPAFHIGVAQDLQQRGLAAVAQGIFQIGGVVEIILQRSFPPRGHENEILDPGGARLVDCILDQGLIHQSHDFLGNGFCGGQKAGAQPCNRENGLGNLTFHLVAFTDPITEPLAQYRGYNMS